MAPSTTSLIQTISRRGTGRLDEPLAVTWIYKPTKTKKIGARNHCRPTKRFGKMRIIWKKKSLKELDQNKKDLFHKPMGIGFKTTHPRCKNVSNFTQLSCLVVLACQVTQVVKTKLLRNLFGEDFFSCPNKKGIHRMSAKKHGFIMGILATPPKATPPRNKALLRAY